VCERVCPAPFGCGSCVILTVAVVSVLLQGGTMPGVTDGVFSDMHRWCRSCLEAALLVMPSSQRLDARALLHDVLEKTA